MARWGNASGNGNLSVDLDTSVYRGSRYESHYMTRTAGFCTGLSISYSWFYIKSLGLVLY